VGIKCSGFTRMPLWEVLSQRGSHVKVGKATLREITSMHRELKKGLERALLKRLEVGSSA
jgi:hypothetical protein